MPFMTVWLFPDEGRKEKIVHRGHPRPTILKLIEDALHHRFITRRDLMLMGLADKPVRFRKRKV